MNRQKPEDVLHTGPAPRGRLPGDTWSNQDWTNMNND